ncbi:hypothetical protein HY503_00105, partial [Candidatus Woesebacteria bacterium]|nr:hypothetical protein [Candidatus Woesebacteria bacterium]
MLPKKYQRGIIDPLSLVALGFLVVSIFVGTAVVSKKGFNFDIREKAKVIGECERDSDCDSGYYCKTGGPITYCEVKPITLKTATPAPQKTPTPAPAKTPTPAATPQVCANDGKCIGPGDVCCSGNDYFDNTCPV